MPICSLAQSMHAAGPRAVTRPSRPQVPTYGTSVKGRRCFTTHQAHWLLSPSLHVHHDIHNVFQHAWPCQVPTLHSMRRGVRALWHTPTGLPLPSKHSL